MKKAPVITVELNTENNKIAFLSDVHWDNPKCKQKTLKRHLDYCLANNIKIFFNGDTFCLMQSRMDRRGNKSDIRPEHNNAMYFDSIVDTAVDFFAPYASIIVGFGYGNHETSIIKFHETDILKRFVDKLNVQTDSNIQLGGYGGWIVVHVYNTSEQVKCTFKGKYFHGSGGGGIVTKGAINLTRALETYEDFDFFTMGHIHENMARNDCREYLYFNIKTQDYESKLKNIHLMITGTYKEEYGDGSQGWHVERGAPPKPIGGRIASFIFQRKQLIKDGKKTKETFKMVDSQQITIA